MINIVVAIAGEGKRFRDAGYAVPKPFIDVKGKTMLERALDNLYIPGTRFIVIARSAHLNEYKEVISALQKKYEIELLTIDMLTAGMVSTILFAAHLISTDDPLVVTGCDQVVDIPMEDFIRDAQKRNVGGSLMTFYATHPKWSYVEINDNGDAIRVKEKEPISTHANVGIYYFAHGKDFVQAASQMIAQNDRVNNEFYVAPVYNYMIKNGIKVGIYEIKESQMHGLGTPEDLEEFIRMPF